MIKTILAFAILSASPAWSADLCKNVFADGLQLNSSIFDPVKQDDARLVPGMISKILSMSAHTLNESMGSKYTLEKGEITLGHPLVDGWTLEFNYKRDARTSDVAYRLTDIQVLQPNGDAVKLTKNPTTAEGSSFAKDHLSLAELAEAKIKIPLNDSVVNVDAPVVIRGELLKSIEKWIPYLEFMNRGNLRLAQESNLGKLKSKAFLKSNVQYTQEIIKKQSFKFVLLGIAMYAYLQKDQVVDYVFDTDPWSTLIEGSSFEKLSSMEQSHIVRLLKDNVNLELTEKIANFHKNKKSSNKSYNNVSEILNKTNSLKKTEKKSGGAAVVYIFKNGRAVSGNPQKILSLIDSSTDDQIVLAFHYPASRRMLVVTNTMMQEKTEESFLTVAIDGEQDRDMYVAIKNNLKNFEINE